VLPALEVGGGDSTAGLTHREVSTRNGLLANDVHLNNSLENDSAPSLFWPGAAVDEMELGSVLLNHYGYLLPILLLSQVFHSDFSLTPFLEQRNDVAYSLVFWSICIVAFSGDFPSATNAVM